MSSTNLLKRKGKSVHSGSKKDEYVKDILKQISSIKHELVSIKSRKKLSTVQQSRPQLRLQKENESESPGEEGTLKKTKKDAGVRQTEPQYPSGNTVRIFLNPISGTKNREAKLKANIIINRIKTLLERPISRNGCLQEQRQQLGAEINFLTCYLDNHLLEQANLIDSLRGKEKQQEEKILNLTKKIEKLAYKNLTNKELSSERRDQIEQLRRNLSYYLDLMTASKQQAETLTRQSIEREKYVVELERNNDILRQSIRSLSSQNQEMTEHNHQAKEQSERARKQLQLLQEDLNAREVENQRNRRQKRQLQLLVDRLNSQLDANTQHNIGNQQKIKELQRVNEELNYEMLTNHQQQAELSGQIHKLKREQEKLTKIIDNLKDRSENNEKVTASQQNINQQLKIQLEELTNKNQQLLEQKQYLQEQIESMSQEIDELKRANDRYKNMHFRNKIRDESPRGAAEGSISKSRVKKSKETSKRKSAAIEQIFSIIDKHKNVSLQEQHSSSDSDDI